MRTQKFIQIFQKFQEIQSFSEFGPRQSFDQRQMAFDNHLGYILSILYMQNFIKIFHLVQEIHVGPFSLFHNLELGKASIDDKCHFAISWARSCQCQCVFKSLSKYSKRFKSCGHFSRTVRGQTTSKTVR